jgi:hypothetical protein
VDIIKLIGICSANYRNWPEEGKEEHMIELWEMMLSDLPLDVAKRAVQYHISKSVFPPTIADIREAAAKIANPRKLEWIEAWDLIGQAIRKYGYYRETDAIATLPGDVAQMVKRFTWRELCLNENIDTLRAQFRMAWETQTKRLNEQNILPEELVAMIEGQDVIKRLA